MKVTPIKEPEVVETEDSATVEITDESVYSKPMKFNEQSELVPPEEKVLVQIDVSVLRPCPKCKSENIHQTYLEITEREYIKYCDDCGFQGPGSLIGYADAERLWNEQ
jgi:predicted RNA-binding Zn-ribbon protein involved in translation (DUF1610 family)